MPPYSHTSGFYDDLSNTTVLARASHTPTGFLVPTQAGQEVRSSGDEEMPEEVSAKVNDADDTETSEQPPRVNYLPSSMGLSVLLGPHTRTLQAVIRWADYYWEAEEKATEPNEEEAVKQYEAEASKLGDPEGGT